VVRPFRPLGAAGQETWAPRGGRRLRLLPAVDDDGNVIWRTLVMALIFGHGQQAVDVLELDADTLYDLWDLRESFNAARAGG
jgi:hypothetical protein